MQVPENSDRNLSSGKSLTDGELGYPVHISFLELSKMYLQKILWNWHPEIEIMYVCQGEASLITDDKKIQIQSGQGVFIGQNVIHSVLSPDSSEECCLYSITFHPSFLFGYGNTLMNDKFLSPLLSSPAYRVIPLNKQTPAFDELIAAVHSIICANQEKKYGYELITKSCLCQFWISLLENLIPPNIRSSLQDSLPLDEIRVKEAIMYMEEHYFEHISLKQIADFVHISKSECCRCFKRTLQLSPIEYLMRYRIFKAVSLIQSGAPAARSISELAFNVGFNNVSYFNKVFKQYINCTPSEYRKGIKEAPQNALTLPELPANPYD